VLPGSQLVPLVTEAPHVPLPSTAGGTVVTELAEETGAMLVQEPSQGWGASNGVCWPVSAGHAAALAVIVLGREHPFCVGEHVQDPEHPAKLGAVSRHPPLSPLPFAIAGH
jgi:hypothetical protein